MRNNVDLRSADDVLSAGPRLWPVSVKGVLFNAASAAFWHLIWLFWHFDGRAEYLQKSLHEPKSLKDASSAPQRKVVGPDVNEVSRENIKKIMNCLRVSVCAGICAWERNGRGMRVCDSFCENADIYTGLCRGLRRLSVPCRWRAGAVGAPGRERPLLSGALAPLTAPQSLTHSLGPQAIRPEGDLMCFLGTGLSLDFTLRYHLKLRHLLRLVSSEPPLLSEIMLTRVRWDA